MPGINARFSKELHCSKCGDVLGATGEYATVISEDGAIMLFSDTEPPQNLSVALQCSKGHYTSPEGCAFELWFLTPRTTKKASGKVIGRLRPA